MSIELPKSTLTLTSTIDEYRHIKDLSSRRLYLYGTIDSIDYDENIFSFSSAIGEMVKCIKDINEEDKDIPPEERRPIIIYINSPGGDLIEGFSLVAAIELSKTPIYTVNVGQWSSMSFLIGIAGHKRFSLPYMTFLLHEGSSFAGGAVNKVQDRVKFEERFETEVVKPHVLKNSNMKSVDYDALARVEYYLLPEDALERGFIDVIVSDIDEIL